jgi:hypothetical protein
MLANPKTTGKCMIRNADLEYNVYIMKSNQAEEKGIRGGREEIAVQRIARRKMA